MTAIIEANPIKGISFAPPQKGDSCLLVIFGASGDLARRKLIPSLYNLACVGCMNPEFDVLGTGRTPMSDEDFRARYPRFRRGHVGRFRQAPALLHRRLHQTRLLREAGREVGPDVKIRLEPQSPVLSFYPGLRGAYHHRRASILRIESQRPRLGAYHRRKTLRTRSRLSA